MENLNNFRLNQEEKNSLENIKDLKNYIDNFFLHEELKNFVLETSTILNLDENIVGLKSKKLLFQKFTFKINKFENSFSFLKAIYQFFIFFVIFFKITLSKKSQEQKLKRKIMLFNIDSIDDIEKFKKVLSSYESSVIVTKKKINLKNISKHTQDKYLKENLILKYNNDYLDLSFKDKSEKYSIKTNIINERDIGLDRNCIPNKKQILKYVLKLFFQSLKFKFNFIQIFNIIFYSAVKNYSIFKKYEAKYFLQDRINYTCPIRNYLFKKMGGHVSGCVQTHLTEASISLYNDIDLFMTFGDEQYSKNLLMQLGSRIGESKPVGSLRVENFLNKSSKKFNYDKEIDILIFGVNLYNWLYINNESKKNYYKFLNYIRILSDNYKDLKIVFKHHPNNIMDSKEVEIMKNSNVIYLDKKINSYSLIKNSKLFLSYSSTLIVETSGLLGKSYFVDPNNNNKVFFNESDNFNKIKLVDFADIEKIVDTVIYKKENEKRVLNDICLDSKNVSELIVKNLRGL